MGREIKQRFSKDYSKTDGDCYTLAHLIKPIPGGFGGGGHGTIRDKSGSTIGGGDVWHFSDTDGNRYNLLITPAVFEEFKVPKPFGRSIPGEFCVKLNLRDLPDEALGALKVDLFEEKFADEYDEDGEPVYWFHIHKEKATWVDERTLRIQITSKHDMSYIATCLRRIEDNYLNEDMAIGNKRIWIHGQFIFTFPEPWVLDTITSPSFTGSQKIYRQGLYAWYYGRYGIFDTFEADHCWTGIVSPFPEVE